MFLSSKNVRLKLIPAKQLFNMMLLIFTASRDVDRAFILIFECVKLLKVTRIYNYIMYKRYDLCLRKP